MIDSFDKLRKEKRKLATTNVHLALDGTIRAVTLIEEEMKINVNLNAKKSFSLFVSDPVYLETSFVSGQLGKQALGMTECLQNVALSII